MDELNKNLNKKDKDEEEVVIDDKKDEKKRKKLRFWWFLLVPVVVIDIIVLISIYACQTKHIVKINQPDLPLLEKYTVNVGGEEKETEAKTGEKIRISVVDKQHESGVPVSMVSKVVITTTSGKEVELELIYDAEKDEYYAEYEMGDEDVQINIQGKADIGYYFHDKPAEGTELATQNVYYQETLSDSKETIIYAYNFSDLFHKQNPQPTKTINRKNFNDPIYVGNKIKKIPDTFLAGCDAFNNTIIFDADSTCESIGKWFLHGCNEFNQKLEFPDSLKKIGGDFLFECAAFNNNGSPLNLNKIEYLADSITSDDGAFLYKCSNFNVPLEMPNIKEISRYFMVGCEKFEQALTIPTTTELIGEFFMLNTYAMNNYAGNGKLIVECPISSFYYPGDTWTCSTTDFDKVLAACGGNIDNWVFKVEGKNGEKFIKDFGYSYYVSTEPEKMSHFRRTSATQPKPEQKSQAREI